MGGAKPRMGKGTIAMMVPLQKGVKGELVLVKHLHVGQRVLALKWLMPSKRKHQINKKSV